MNSIIQHLFSPQCIPVLLSLLAFGNGNVNAQNASFVASGSALKIVANGSPVLVLNNTNYKNEASATHFSGATSTVRFEGSGAVASVSSTGSYATVFADVYVNRTNGLTLGTPVSATGTLTMNAGNITTTATNLLTVGESTAVPGSLTWNAGTVIGPLKRFYSTTSSGTQAAGIFPVGNASVNRWARVNFTSNMATSGFITAQYVSGICPIIYSGLPATINGQLITNYENEGYWQITPTGGNLNTTNYDLVLRGNQLTTVSDLAKLRVIKSSNHTAWNDNPAGDGNHVAASGTTADFTIGASAMLGFSWFNIGSDNTNPLPVTLTQLSAHCSEAGVQIDWKTATESNSQKFTIERSRDLISWTASDELDAAGNSSTPIHYQSFDSNPFSGNSYYRLVQTDNNGAEKIYGPVSVSCGEMENGIFVYPNPAQQDFTLAVSSVLDIANAKLELSDIAGKIISVRSVQISAGNNQFPFEGLDLQSGTYMVRVLTDGDQFKPVKVVVK